MKKYAFLTSVLALAACGGGSGGGGVAPAPVRTAVSQDAINSNKAVTSMASEILIAKDGSGDRVARSPSVSYNGKTYDSYRLDDVTFKLAGEDSRLIFEVDGKGKIIAVGKYDRDFSSVDEPKYVLGEIGNFKRTSNTGTEFAKTVYIYTIDRNALDFQNGVDEIASDHFYEGIDFMSETGGLSNNDIKKVLKAKLRKEIDEIKASQYTDDPSYEQNLQKLEHAYDVYAARIDAQESFETAAVVNASVDVQSVDIGLRYADLGFAEMTATEGTETVEHTFSPYVGGYDVLKIEPAQLESDTTFVGTAIAGIDHKREGHDDGLDIKEGVLVRQDNAELTMHRDGSFSLVMNNLVNEANASQHWYTVQVDRDTNGLPTFTIGGTNTITGEKQGVEAYNLPSGPASYTFTANQLENVEREYVDHSHDNHRIAGYAEADIYRFNAGDTEATSRFNFSDEEHDGFQSNEVAIYGAFGGKPTGAQ